MLLAEGFGHDAKGAITAIGVNQSVVIAPTLPATTKRALLVHLSDDEGLLRPGTKLHFSIAVYNPSGRALLAQSGQIALGEKPWPDLPATVDIPAEFTLTTNEYGEHSITAQVQFDGTEAIESSIPLHVVPAPAGSIELNAIVDGGKSADAVDEYPSTEGMGTRRSVG
jgi:hypothetical protein